MGTQLILCLETNKQTNSDLIYINSTIKHFYKELPTSIKISKVYMNGKYNYNSRKVKREIENLSKQYGVTSKLNKSVVIFCFDCDEYDIKNEDRIFLSEAKAYCLKKDYRFVWFCKEIEQVFLHERVPDNEKKKCAEVFQRKHQIEQVDFHCLEANEYQIYKSNLALVLDEFIQRE